MVSVSFTHADEMSHRQAAEELLQTMKVEKQMETAMNQMLDVQMKAQPALVPYKDVMRKFLDKHISYAALKDELIQIYVDEFTEPELKQIVAFYKTPPGKKIVEKGPALMTKGMQLGVQRVAKHQDELKQMIEEEAKKQKKNP
jgi:hypothetical protein